MLLYAGRCAWRPAWGVAAGQRPEGVDVPFGLQWLAQPGRYLWQEWEGAALRGGWAAACPAHSPFGHTAPRDGECKGSPRMSLKLNTTFKLRVRAGPHIQIFAY